MGTTQVFTFTVFPDHLNWSGSLFGGKLLAEMDSAAANCARKLLYSTPANGLVTASLERVDFKAPAYLGDIIELHTKCVRLGNSSLEIYVDVMKESKTGERTRICDATFVFVALRDNIPFHHGLTEIQTETLQTVNVS